MAHKERGNTGFAAVTHLQKHLSDKRIQQITALIVFVLGWEIFGHLTSFYFPPLSETLVAFVDLFASGRIFEPLFSSLQQLFVGFFLAILVSFPVGLAMGTSKKVEYLLDSYVTIMFVTSITSLLPLLIIIFGTDFKFRVVIVFLFSVFHMILEIQSGIQNIERRYIETAAVFGASSVQIYRHVKLPAALPFVIAALRIGIGRSVKGMVAAELWIVAGIAALMISYQQQLQTEYVMAIIIVLSLIAIISVQVLYKLERRFAPWREETHN